MHPRVLGFFNGAFDQIEAAFASSAGLADATSGVLRESGVRRAIEKSLPTVARLVSGDIIDAEGRQSGALDGVVVHATSPALGFEESDPRIILAEGVIGVIEVKSDLARQWSQVERTWDALHPIRREEPSARFAQGTLTIRSPTDPLVESPLRAIPFFVIGRKGWADARELMKRARSLHDAFRAPNAPPIYVLSMDPPGIGVVHPYEPPHFMEVHTGWRREERGQVIAQLWAQISDRARSVVLANINLHRYFGSAATTD